MDKKRILLIIIFITVCILLGFAIYFVFFKKSPNINTNVPVDNTGTTENTFPSVSGNNGTSNNVTNITNNTQNNNNNNINNVQTLQDLLNSRFETTQAKNLVNKLTELDIMDVSPASGNGLRFYNKQDGKFYKISSDGTIIPMSNTVFFGVANVTWSAQTDVSIIEYPDGANIYYNFKTGEQVTLPQHWQDFSFAKDGSQIAAESIGIDPDNRWLITSEPTGKNIKLIEPLGENADKVIVDWSPNRQVLAFSATGEAMGSDRQQILAIGLNHENYKGLEVEGRGLEFEWSNDGSKLLHSVYSSQSNYKPQLWIVDATPDTMGNNRKNLNINTWASKCTMEDSRFIYCGVPTSIETGAGFAPEINNEIPDEIYKIDTQTGIKTLIPTDGTHNINTMNISEDGTTLYFTDTNQTGIFDIPIK